LFYNELQKQYWKNEIQKDKKSIKRASDMEEPTN